ncbi:GATA-type domain-containing protein [Fusarium falciforme]|uniref:GATA-type domain-containing protein n=1 Tax=Fusarium falciforme TaxID=195108 RepID=UPI002300500D|nr:GATA-type domain-containing protein [Fusarium falciforme]WAO85287.1 GATA-type domain-containing protein [Fusarium falciforme]
MEPTGMTTSASMEDELPQTTTTQQDHDPNGAPPGLADIAAICAASEKLRTLCEPYPSLGMSPSAPHTAAPPAASPAVASPAVAPPTATSHAATSGGSGSNLPTCQNCSTSTTPLWRRDEFGSVLCNACGLFLKLHGRPRPISLKTDVIKSRNRVKTMRPDLANKKKQQQQLQQQQQQQQQQQAQNFVSTDPNGVDITGQTAAAAAHAAQAARRTSQKSANGHDGSDSPISRTGTPSMYSHSLSSFMVEDPYQTGYVATGEGRATSPLNGDRKMEAPQTHEQLIAHNSSLKTRVSELEVIIELFRGRLSQLEQQEAVARSGQQVAGAEQTQLRSQLEATRESEAQLRAQLEDSHRRENSLKRRLDDLELELKAAQDAREALEERPAKKPRIAEVQIKDEVAAGIEAAAEALLAAEAVKPTEPTATEPAPAPAVEAPEAPVVSQAPEVAQPSETAEVPAATETADSPVAPEATEATATAEATETSESKEVTKAPEDIEIPDAPAASEVSAPEESAPEITEGVEATEPAIAATA